MLGSLSLRRSPCIHENYTTSGPAQFLCTYWRSWFERQTVKSRELIDVTEEIVAAPSGTYGLRGHAIPLQTALTAVQVIEQENPIAGR
jgi:hypothetical protein